MLGEAVCEPCYSKINYFLFEEESKMEKTIDQLCQIVGAGGSIKIDASKKTPFSI